MLIHLHRSPGPLRGNVVLAGSKSISNRVLIIQALCTEAFPILGLASAKDTQLMQALLQSNEEVLDAGAAGTTFRFLTALLSLREGTQVLTGSARMKQRPIGALVEALRTLGADIQYLEKEGYPPLRIGPPRQMGVHTCEISIPADTSSQYISALLLIAPVLPHGLALRLEGHIVSRPYIEMTLRLMEYFGVEHVWEGNAIHIENQVYTPRPFEVEADWSAASYYYAMAAMASEAEFTLGGLFAHSLQGDAVLSLMMQQFGIETTFTAGAAHLRKAKDVMPASNFEWDFITCPDLAQTLAATCAGLGVKGLLTGLETLRIKETDRIAALQKELSKVGVAFEEVPPHLAPCHDKPYFALRGKAHAASLPVFDTYEDHRMAMAMAPLAMCFPIAIRDPQVVEKSYPDFWKDLEKVGFAITIGAAELA